MHQNGGRRDTLAATGAHLIEIKAGRGQPRIVEERRRVVVGVRQRRPRQSHEAFHAENLAEEISRRGAG